MNTKAQRTLHPMILSACVAVLFFSAVGIAAIMGWIPGSFAQNKEDAELSAVKQSSEEKSAAAPKEAKRATPVQKAQAKPVHVASNSKPICGNCGVIESMHTIETNGEGSGVGAVGGAMVGGLLGNQVGGGNGKKAMTVVGAVGGALAGNHIEKRVKSATTYEVLVRMENGSSRVVNESTQPTWRNGDRVKIVDGVIRAA
jgi:outer membrane lipoprotein SlyB